MAAGRGTVGLCEAGEQAADLLRRQADAGVGDGKADTHMRVCGGAQAGSDVDIPRLGELHRIAGVMAENLRDTLRVSHQGAAEVGVHPAQQAQTFVAGGFSHGIKHLVQQAL